MGKYTQATCFVKNYKYYETTQPDKLLFGEHIVWYIKKSSTAKHLKLKSIILNDCENVKAFLIALPAEDFKKKLWRSCFFRSGTSVFF